MKNETSWSWYEFFDPHELDEKPSSNEKTLQDKVNKLKIQLIEAESKFEEVESNNRVLKTLYQAYRESSINTGNENTELRREVLKLKRKILEMET